MKMCDTVDQARIGAQKIDELLKQKLLSVNQDKSKYLLIGNKKAKDKLGLSQAKLIVQLSKDKNKVFYKLKNGLQFCRWASEN